MNDPSTDPDLIRFLDDATVLAAYQRKAEEPDSLEAAALLAEIKRRELDV